MTFSNTIKSVAVIGAGPSGLAAAKALLAEGVFSKVKVFERQNQAGGVWVYNSHKRDTPLVPSVNADVQEPTKLDDKLQRAVYYSPMYKYLETNLPKYVMQYNELRFGEDLPVFPPKSDVLEYIQEYAKPLAPVIRYNSEVRHMEKAHRDGPWTIEYVDYTENYPQGTTYEEQFDAVVVSTGHYDLPYIPEVTGIAEWSQKYPGSVQHAKYFDDPKDFTGKTVVVVGNAASGVDISLQAANFASKVYRSVAGPPLMPYGDDPRVQDVPVISEYRPATHEILLTDGQVLSDVDVVIYCTGYLYTLPFLRTYMDPESPDCVLKSSGKRLHRVYKHIFYIPDPSLSFVGAPKQIIPFPMAETQAAVIARVYSKRLGLPDESNMRADEKLREKETGPREMDFHLFQFPGDFDYYRELESWIDEAEKTEAKEFLPERWTAKRFEQRSESYALKTALVKAKQAQGLV